MARPIVATITGIIPKRSSGSAIARLKPQPSTITATMQVNANAARSGIPNDENASIVKAGSITKSPGAKLIVPDACHISVKPSAATAYMLPVARPDSSSCRKSVKGLLRRECGQGRDDGLLALFDLDQ